MLISYYPHQISTHSLSNYYEFQVPVTIPEKNISKQIEIINQLNEYSCLKENWDSYGASAIAQRTIDIALDVVKLLHRKNIDIYYTAPSPKGDVLIEIRNMNKSIEIEILPEGKIKFEAYQDENLFESGDLKVKFENEILNWYLR